MAWQRYRDTICDMAGASCMGGSLAPSIDAACRARLAVEWSARMVGVLRSTH
jgi:uncharacterized protein YecT (DUF1311 family)